MSNISYTSQIQILHFSDFHFGDYHICNPPDIASANGIPTLADHISKDLQQDFGATVSDKTDFSNQQESPLIIAASGDFTQIAIHKEFEEARAFLDKLNSTKLLNRKVDKRNIFITPGNHDVKYTSENRDERFQPYCNFYNKFFEGIRPPQFPHQPNNLTQVHMREIDNNKFLVVEINCCVHVEKDTMNESRGQVDFEAIEKLSTDLEFIKSKHADFDDYIKIAIIHHHVVLLPTFIENKRGIDSITNAGHLLEILSTHNFHLILHGHKHYPQIFNYEPIPLWNKSSGKIPQIVVAGGSCGSTELPVSKHDKASNTYSIITIKWHPEAQQARVQVITRGLKRSEGAPLPPFKWKWETINVSDRMITPYITLPTPGPSEVKTNDDDTQRLSEYEKLRYHMPVVEVMPSLIPKQAYEARAWIVIHRSDLYNKAKLIKVEWTAGSKFKKVICLDTDNPNFSFSYHYWGPMLIQAKMYFEDGYIAYGYVYARMPKDESKQI